MTKLAIGFKTINQGILIVLFAVALVTQSAICAELNPIRLGVAQLPKLAETQNNGTLINLVNHLNKHYFDGSLSIQVMPFGRSFVALANDQVDVHLPIIYDEEVADSDTLLIPNHSNLTLSQMLFSEQTLFKVPFVILSHKELKGSAISESNKYQIETDVSHLPFFNVLLKGSYCISCSIGKVMKRRIDGYLFAETEIKTVIEQLNFQEAYIHPYRTYDARFMVKKNSRGKAIAKKLDTAIASMKRHGTYGEIMSVLLVKHPD